MELIAESNVKPLGMNRSRLIFGMLVTLFVSLSIHVVMLQVLMIPFPVFDGVSWWASLLNTALSILAVIYFCRLATPLFARRSWVVRCLITFAVYAMVKETARGILMNGVVTTGWAYDVIAGLPSVFSALGLTAMVVLVAPALRAMWMKLAAAACIAGIVVFALRPLVRILLAPALKAASHLDHAEVYSFPYGWHVLAPAYLTFAEPVLASTIIAAMVWATLSKNGAVRLLQFTLMICLMRGMLLPTFIFSFYSELPLLSAMVSQSQFLLETIALGCLTGITWQLSTTTVHVKGVSAYRR